MNRTLPLFEGLEGAPGESGDSTAHTTSAPGAGERHLRAAWRLSRSMWRYRDHSAEQTRAGLAICQHLQGLLSQAQSADPPRAEPE